MEKSINKSLLYRNKIITSVKRSRVFLLCLIMVSCFVNAQVNLIINPSFEQLDSCPNYNMRVNLATHWDNLNPNPPCQSILYSSCSLMPSESGVPSHNNGGGNCYQWPRTGNNYIQAVIYSPLTTTVFPNYRTYNIGRLSSTLINGKEYCGKIYLNLDNVSPYKTNQFGLYFDDGSITGSHISCNSALNITPQVASNPSTILSDTLGWIKVQGSFVANGNENRITIGNFRNDIATIGIATGFPTTYVSAVYNIDDVSLIPIEIAAYAGKDATICVGDSLSLGRTPETGIECQWYKPGNPVPFSNISNFTFKADSEGTYTFIQRMDNCKITFDTVTVTVESDCNTTLEIPNVFTPNEDGVNDAWRFAIKHATDVKYSIYNRWGNLMKDSTLIAQTVVSWDGRTTSGEACTAGVYYYVLTYTDAKGEAQHRNGYITLIH